MEEHVDLSRKERRLDAKDTSGRRKKAIVIGALALVAILAIGALFILGPPPIQRMINTYRLGADVDAQIDYLYDLAPELFTPEWGGHSQDELQQRFEGSLKDKNLLVAEAKRQGVTVDESKVESSFDALKSGFAARGDFSEYLRERGITEKQLKAALEGNMLITELARVLVSEADITEAQARAYFDQNEEKYTSHASKKVSHILFGASQAELASDISKQISAGADFEALATEHSKDSESAKRGGDIGWSTSTYPETFQKAVDTLGKGQVSDPVSTRYGIHLIKVTDTKEAASSYEQAKEQVVADLLGKLRAEAIDSLLKELKG